MVLATDPEESSAMASERGWNGDEYARGYSGRAPRARAIRRQASRSGGGRQVQDDPAHRDDDMRSAPPLDTALIFGGDGMSRWLERLVGAACLVAIAYAIVATVVAVRHLPSRRPPTNEAVGQKIQIGARFGALPDSLLPAGRKLLVLALREDCVYCRQSLPLYRNLSQMARQPDALFSLVVIGAESADRLNQYLQSEGIHAAVLQVPLKQYVRGTPTIVLCDQNGAVQQVWTGLLAKEMELAVVDAVTAQSRGKEKADGN